MKMKEYSSSKLVIFTILQQFHTHKNLENAFSPTRFKTKISLSDGTRRICLRSTSIKKRDHLFLGKIFKIIYVIVEHLFEFIDLCN